MIKYCLLIFICELLFMVVKMTSIRSVISNNIVKAVASSAVISTLHWTSTLTGVYSVVTQGYYLVPVFGILGAVIGTFIGLKIK